MELHVDDGAFLGVSVSKDPEMWPGGTGNQTTNLVC